MKKGEARFLDMEVVPCNYIIWYIATSILPKVIGNREGERRRHNVNSWRLILGLPNLNTRIAHIRSSELSEALMKPSDFTDTRYQSLHYCKW
jgi:hypothetical protein